MTVADIRVSIDRGGTFCDVIAHVDGREPIIFKLLSVDPANYQDAPTEGIRRVLEIVEGRKIPVGEKLDGTRIASCRLGTTVATNALLEGKYEKFALVTTKGFEDVCVIGDQSRPKLFDLQVKKAEALHDTVIGVDERVTIEDYDLNPYPLDKSAVLNDPDLVRTPSGEIIRILARVNEDGVREQLLALREAGYSSVAISFMHSYIFPDHEDQVARIARKVGFTYVTTSSETRPVLKYLNRIQRQRSSPQRSAGGVVGIATSCYDIEEKIPIIGFDMGGTSTDVSRFDGKYDYLSETVIADRTISMPMLNISTVAAGGGSILFARSGLLVVGPESAGAHPGPACYRKGGPLTVTDANLFLGRLVVSSFPSIFGENADQPLNQHVVAAKFEEITAEFNSQTSQNLTAEEVALGFLDVANEAMSRPIRNTTEARGFAPEKHNLVSFGGAGGQHACAIASKLGIKRVLIHKWSSLLSAHGISQADLQYESFEPLSLDFGMNLSEFIKERLSLLRKRVSDGLVAQGAQESTLRFDDSLVMKYFGTDTTITVTTPADLDYGAAFEALHLREFAFKLNRKIVVDSVNVRGTGSAVTLSTGEPPLKTLARVKATATTAQATEDQKVYIEGSWRNLPVYRLDQLPKGCGISGPAMIIDQTQTIFVEPRFNAYILPDHVILEESEIEATATKQSVSVEGINPLLLSVFAHRFMSIAEQMGNTLQRTSVSSSIKERLDFSCAIFSREGKLVANAPHIPIHLGSMQMAIRYQHEAWKGQLKPGDALVTNHPLSGGTHLPDLTVVSPVFINGDVAFYVASRGHHTDIGGKGIAAMMPESKELWEEGISIKTMKIVSGGEFLEDEIRAAFDKAGSFPGCSPTRRIADNLSDLKAQIASNQRGIILLGNLCEEFTLPVVCTYMEGIQANAEFAVRRFLKELAKKHPEPLTAVDYFDDGTPIKIKITIDPETGGALYDFTACSTPRPPWPSAARP
ncbi:hypothetical protein G7054_g13964 [Neopestalotiopsis clavispora]|nr:hypothetical protein G7054_g13964 [Neopestalotiopsis clavispora]